jgi:tetratricopeptide (TPR) repeat protein
MADTLRDPAGLLERAPEIGSLAEADGSVRKALAKGDPREVYRALWWARLLGRLKPHRSTLDALLEHRRLFAAPYTRSPALGSVNGVGATLYGHSERDTDGTYVKSHFLILAFVPVFPFAQYLVKDADASGRSWYVIAKVPTSFALRLWRGAVVAAVMVTLATAAFRTFHASRHHDVHVVNSLPVRVGVQIGPVRADVPSGERRTLTVPVGSHAVRTTDPSGVELESDHLVVDAGPHVIAWNVLGAGSVYQRTVIYGNPGPNAKDSTPHFECGRRAIRTAGIDFMFTDAPASISLPEGQPYALRKHMAVMTPTAGLCAAVLSQAADTKAALALAKELERFGDETTTQIATFLWRRLGRLDEAVAVARRAIERHPDAIELHRNYQTVAKEHGLHAALRDEYRARAEAAPDSADAAYLHARVLPSDEAHAMSSATLKRFPDHVPSLRLRLYGSVRRLDFDEALSLLERMRTLAPDEWMAHVEEHAEVLAAIRRTDEAKALLEQAFPRAPEEEQARLAAIHYWLTGASDPSKDVLVRRVTTSSAADALRFRIRFWSAPVDLAFRPALPAAEHAFQQMALHAHFDPAVALRDALAVSPDILAELDEEVLLLLVGEALRQANAATRERLEAAARLNDLPFADIAAYLERAAWSEDVERLSLPRQGALHLARSRRREVAPTERERLRALAARCDPAGGFVTRALAEWPAP